MLRTRLVVGAVLALFAVGILVLDQAYPPYYPFLTMFVLAASLAAGWELLHLLPSATRPSSWLCSGALAVLALANKGSWELIAALFAAVVLAAFLVEMAGYVEAGTSVPRLALTVWIVAYLGILPCFFVQLRSGGNPLLESADQRGTLAVALAIFVPKGCDIGAYFTGRLLGRHPMASRLSPKKTWEGAAGGLASAVFATLIINALRPIVPGGWAGAIGFGLSVGLAGILGDLAESLIKRDCQAKDASQIVPGFGGVLDVVDSIVFAAPVAYWWLRPT